MLESIIQFLNDHMEAFYSLIRRFVDYTPIKESAKQLDVVLAIRVKELLKQKGYPLKNNQYCLVTKENKKITFLILNEKNRLSKQIVISDLENVDLSSLGERVTYFIVDSSVDNKIHNKQ